MFLYLLWYVLGFNGFIGLKWLIKAWGWVPILNMECPKMEVEISSFKYLSSLNTLTDSNAKTD